MLTLLLALRLLTAEVLDNAAVVKMVSAGLGPDVITLKIEHSQGAFDTSTDGLIALKNAHVPDVVLLAMLSKGDSASPVPPAAATATPASRTAAAAPIPASTPAPAAIPTPPSPPVPLAAPPLPARPSDLCANVKFFGTGND